MTDKPSLNILNQPDAVIRNQEQVEHLPQTQYDLSRLDFPAIAVSLIENEESEPVLIAKLVVLGDQQAGKTTLVKKLFDGQTVSALDTDEAPNGHIDVRKYVLKLGDQGIAHINAWEFRGTYLDISAALVFNESAIYIVVLDASKSESKSRISNWLDLIVRHDSAASIVVVSNKADLGELYLDQNQLRHSYSSRMRFFTISCQTGHALDALRETIHELIAAQARQLTRREWVGIYHELARKRSEMVLLPLHRFIDICFVENVVSHAEQSDLLKLLESGGSVSCYRDEFGSLRDVIVLNPNGLVDNVLSMLRTEESEATRVLITVGLQDHSLISPHLQDEDLSFIMQIMVDRGLWIRTKSRVRFVVPSALPNSPINPFPLSSSALTRRYYFSSSPRPILWALMADFSTQVLWNEAFIDGAQINVENCVITVTAEPGIRSLDIAVEGVDVVQRTNALAIFAHSLRSITQQQGSQIDRVVVPLSDNLKVEVPLEHLQILAKMKEKAFVPYGTETHFSVAKLLYSEEYASHLTDTQLYERLHDRMSRGDLKVLCAQMGISEGDMDQGDLTAFALSVVKDCQRRRQRDGRVQILKAHWPQKTN